MTKVFRSRLEIKLVIDGIPRNLAWLSVDDNQESPDKILLNAKKCIDQMVKESNLYFAQERRDSDQSKWSPQKVSDCCCHKCGKEEERKFVYSGNSLTVYCKGCEQVIFTRIGAISKEGVKDYSFINELNQVIAKTNRG